MVEPCQPPCQIRSAGLGRIWGPPEGRSGLVSGPRMIGYRCCVCDHRQVTDWDDDEAVRRRKEVSEVMSRQAQRLDDTPDAIHDSAGKWLENNDRAGQAVWLLATKQAEFGHLVAEGYRRGRYTAIAALVRTLFEDATLLSWMAIPNESGDQVRRVVRVLVDYYRDARNQGNTIPPDAEQLLRDTTGKDARKPPSWEDRVSQLDEDEHRKENGKPFWDSHKAHVEFLNDYVHSSVGGSGQFTDAMTRELLGYEALVFGHQYLTLSIVAIARLSNQNEMCDEAQAAFGVIHDQETEELRRLFKDETGEGVKASADEPPTYKEGPPLDG
jgi:hypothetical protein